MIQILMQRIQFYAIIMHTMQYIMQEQMQQFPSYGDYTSQCNVDHHKQNEHNHAYNPTYTVTLTPINALFNHLLSELGPSDLVIT